ncbi:hypothetical protein HPP92_024669 [Vanilla planifolia]|uniref:Uncharacterized protein n=1 Tax=Vanilla planifolia TaxID=51239 RepID=A0A835UEW9_VANPL|nr:hypothetical protein HPP92_024963 [Vanilla planifolia]KAG0456881.1 hypothetical protein HPP92_024669 [Vanilla planifolia]
MDLSNNAFTGEIPPSFAELKNLTLVNLFRNKLIAHSTAAWISGRLKLVDLSTKLLAATSRWICAGEQPQTWIALGNFLFGSIQESSWSSPIT